MEDFLMIPWVRTGLALVLPVAVMFLLLRIILLSMVFRGRGDDPAVRRRRARQRRRPEVG